MRDTKVSLVKYVYFVPLYIKYFIISQISLSKILNFDCEMNYV